MDWDKLRIFHAAAKVGSFTHAGHKLHMSQSALSRQIQALEDTFGTPLFHRHARGLILTEQGEFLYDAVVAMQKRLEVTTARIKDSKEETFGNLRVTTTTGFGALWVAPRLLHLYNNHPNLNIDLILEDRILDLPMREADVAIRMKEPSQADLIRKRLMSVRIRLYATRKYLDEYGTPTDLSQLQKHRLVLMGAKSAQVTAGLQMTNMFLAQSIHSILTVNSYFGVLQAIAHDMGIGLLPDYIIDDMPHLVRVLPDIESTEVPVYLAYSEELRNSKRVAAFRDFVQDEIITHRKNLRKLNIT